MTATMCVALKIVFIALLGFVQFSFSVFGLQLVPARRITCSRNQPDMDNLFAITLKVANPTQKGGKLTSVIEVRQGKEANILSPPQAPLVRPFLTKSSGGGLFIDVFFLDCPCSGTFSHRGSRRCSDPSPVALNFTCHYVYTVNSKPQVLTKFANVSEVSMTSLACCDPELCSSSSSGEGRGIQGGVERESSHAIGNKPTASSDGDPTRTMLIALVAVFGLLALALACACVYLWKKNQRLQKAQTVFAKSRQEMSRLRENDSH